MNKKSQDRQSPVLTFFIWKIRRKGSSFSIPALGEPWEPVSFSEETGNPSPLR